MAAINALAALGACVVPDPDATPAAPFYAAVAKAERKGPRLTRGDVSRVTALCEAQGSADAAIAYALLLRKLGALPNSSELCRGEEVLQLLRLLRAHPRSVPAQLLCVMALGFRLSEDLDLVPAFLASDGLATLYGAMDRLLDSVRMQSCCCTLLSLLAREPRALAAMQTSDAAGKLRRAKARHEAEDEVVAPAEAALWLLEQSGDGMFSLCAAVAEHARAGTLTQAALTRITSLCQGMSHSPHAAVAYAQALAEVSSEEASDLLCGKDEVRELVRVLRTHGILQAQLTAATALFNLLVSDPTASRRGELLACGGVAVVCSIMAACPDVPPLQSACCGILGLTGVLPEGLRAVVACDGPKLVAAAAARHPSDRRILTTLYAFSQ